MENEEVSGTKRRRFSPQRTPIDSFGEDVGLGVFIDKCPNRGIFSTKSLTLLRPNLKLTARCGSHKQFEQASDESLT